MAVEDGLGHDNRTTLPPRVDIPYLNGAVQPDSPFQRTAIMDVAIDRVIMSARRYGLNLKGEPTILPPRPQESTSEH